MNRRASQVAGRTDVDQDLVDLTSPEAIDAERRRRWLMGLLGPAAAVLCFMAVLTSAKVITGAAQIQLAVALVLLGAWFLTYRGHAQAAYVCAAIAVPASLLARPLSTGNANDNMMYLGVAAMLLLLLAPRRWTYPVITGALGTAALLWWGTSDAATPDLGWTSLAINGLVVSSATLLLGVLTLRSTHGALLGAYSARDQAQQIAADLAQARSALERTVDDRTAHLQQVLAESDALVEQLSTMAMRDHLTGLLNRRYLERELPLRIAAAARTGRTLTVVLIDLVNFKEVNDRYSHDVGDRVLTEAAALLAATLAPGDSICRFGGDEFVVLAQAPTDAAVPALIARMTQALATAELPEAPSVTLGLAYGVASFRGSLAENPEAVAQEVMRLAESDLRQRRASERSGSDDT